MEPAVASCSSIHHRGLVFLTLVLAIVGLCSPFALSQVQTERGESQAEYLWFEAENMRGFGAKPTGEPIQNPSWMNLPRAKAPGWGINGPGVSAEWSQGGESEWNSAAASADETNARIYQDVEIPRGGSYKIWVRYADWAAKSESFTIRVVQNEREVFHHEFGTTDIVDPYDEVSMYWGWAFTWDGAAAGQLEKGPARVSLEIDQPAAARRHVDCVLLTNDLAYVPAGRRKPDFAAAHYLQAWSATNHELSSLLQPLPPGTTATSPRAWAPPRIGGRNFVMPWNINPEFWKLYDKPAAERPLYPFNAEPIEDFVQKYKGARDVPLFSSRFVLPVIYINNLPEYLKEGSPFLRYLRETKVPFAILINYGSASLSETEGQAAWKLLTGELKDQFLGWMSGESVGYVWDEAPAQLHVTASMSRRELLEAHRVFYTQAIARKWAGIFHTETGAMWDKLIPAQATSSTSFAHALTEWGVRLLGVETAAVQPMFAMRTAFTRGAARQYGAAFLYYQAPNFGDTATTFTKQQNFAGPDNFFHSRYGATMGPSLSWYRKSYYFYYMSGASGIYLEQGFDQFFKPGPGEHDFQLNPLGRITDEFMRFAEKHPERGTPYTPVAFLLDPAHGWDMTDYPQWPFGVSQINESDRALRELFGVAYFPGLVVEGEPATGDRQAFVNGIFGDIFDVLVASDGRTDFPVRPGRANAGTGNDRVTNEVQSPKSKVQSPGSPVYALEPYRAIVVGGRIEWSSQWIQKLTDYVKQGGTVVFNSAQIKGVPAALLGLRLTGATGEAHNARCLSPGEAAPDLHGQVFRYEKLELTGARALLTTTNDEPLVTTNKVGKGTVVFVAVPDLLGEDQRMTPLAAHLLAHVFADATPLKVRGDVEYLVNRNENGWVVTLFNNNGVIKPQQGLAQVDRNAYVSAAISLPGQRLGKVWDWTTEKEVEVKNELGQDGVTVSIAPGGVVVIELRLR